MLLSIQDIPAYVGGRMAVAPRDGRACVTGLTWDSRTVKQGDMYVALPGERVDGYDFAESALADGAAAVLVQKDPDENLQAAARECGAAIIQVEHTFAAVEDLARAWRGELTGTIIALTGSTGKTTTKNLVRDVLAASFKVVATVGNQNNELGVPATILRAERDTQAVVVEMGMRGSGQIAELCEYVRPDWGIVNNVGDAHIELLGSRDAIARAKGELFCALPPGSGRAFVNASDDYAGFLCEHARLRERGVACVSFNGQGGAAAVWAEDVELDGQGSPSFVLCASGFPCDGAAPASGDETVQRRSCTLALRGLHNVSNACAAAAVGLSMGMTLEAVAAALAQAAPERGRQEVLQTETGVTLVNDAYNANPDSMRASLAMFASMNVAGKRIAVLGDMAELGDYAPELHRQVGEYAAGLPLDRLVCVGPLARNIAQAACEAGMGAQDAVCVDDVAEALAVVRGCLASGDAVLAKASNCMNLSQVIKGLVD